MTIRLERLIIGRLCITV